MKITRFSELEQSAEQYAQIEAIFYETTTRKHFIDTEERLAFQYQYLDLYLKNPEWVFLILDESAEATPGASPDTTPLSRTRSPRIVGYLIASPSTSEEVFLLQPSLEAFREPIQSIYPAHLHINLTEKVRGLNLGSKLLEALEEKLKLAKVPGVHLVTVSTARNVSFYRKNLYELVSETQVKGITLLMLGKRLF